MAEDIKWSILVSSVPARRVLRRRLMMVLEPQLEKFPDVELLVLEDNRKRLMGEKWQALIDIAQGEYVSFIDDDDLVSEKYVSMIYAQLLRNPDCIGFTGHISLNEGPTLPVFYSIENKEWRNEPEGYYRYVQHLNPIRRDIVLQVPYSGHSGADKRWVDEVLEKDLLKTERYIEEVLYYYLASTEDSRKGVWT